jgi:SAM-dependent methyltransferase
VSSADTDSASAWEWDRYWQANRMAACLEDRDGTYGPAIASRWQSLAARLPPSAQVLDLGAGNGAASLEIVRGHADALVDAVDLAHIDPPSFVPQFRAEFHRVRFHPGTDMTALPFAEDGYDAVISQYAIEYAPVAAVLAEAGRVLRPGGVFAAIVHATDGAPARGAAEEIADVDFVLGEEGLCAATELALRATQAVGDGTAREAAVVRREGALAATRARRQTVMLANVAAVLDDLYQARESAPLGDLLAFLDNVRREADAHRRRLAALIDAARSRDALASAMAAAAISASVPDAVEGPDGALLGWYVEGRLSKN